MKNKYLLIVIVAIVATFAYVYWPVHPRSSPTSALSPLVVSAAKVPDGWYEHRVETEGAPPPIIVVLTKSEELLPRSGSDDLYGDPQIIIRSATIPGTPEEYIKESLAEGTWGTFMGYKMFTTDETMGPTGKDIGHIVLLFDGTTLHGFVLTTTNSQDVIDFWKVITFYAQQPFRGNEVMGQQDSATT